MAAIAAWVSHVPVRTTLPSSVRQNRTLLLCDRWRGDLRKLRDEAGRDARATAALLTREIGVTARDRTKCRNVNAHDERPDIEPQGPSA